MGSFVSSLYFYRRRHCSIDRTASFDSVSGGDTFMENCVCRFHRYPSWKTDLGRYRLCTDTSGHFGKAFIFTMGGRCRRAFVALCPDGTFMACFSEDDSCHISGRLSFDSICRTGRTYFFCVHIYRSCIFYMVL